MAQEIIFEIDINSKGSEKTLGQIKGEIKDLRKELDGLAVGSDAFEKVKTQIGGLSAVLRDVKEDLRGFKPEEIVKGFANFGATVSGAFAVAQGALNLFGSSSKEVAEAEQKAQSAIALAIGAATVAQNINNASKLVGLGQSKLLNISLALEKTATEGGVVAKYAAAAAQRVLNAVMAANPIGLVVVAVAGLVAALVAFTNSTDDAAESQKKLNEELDKQKAIDERNVKFFNDAAESRIKDFDRRIALAEAEGKSEKEIIELKNQKLRYEKQINEGILNSVQSGEIYNKTLQEQLDKGNEIEVNNAKLKNSLAKTEEDKTKKLKEESEKRTKLREEENEQFKQESKNQTGQNFEQDIANLEDYITKKKAAITNSNDTIVEKEKQLTQLTQDELNAKLAIYEDYGKSTIDIQNQILDSKLNNDKAEVESEQAKRDELLQIKQDALTNEFDVKDLLAQDDEERIQNEIERTKAQLELDLQRFSTNETKKVQIKLLSNAKIKQSEIDLDKARAAIAQSQLASAGNVAGQLSALAKRGSDEQKVLALISIALNTAAGIAGAVKAGAGVPYPGNLVAIFTGIAAVLSGIASAKSALQGAKDGGIAGKKYPAYSVGGFVTDGTTSRADDVPIMVSRGESIINARSTEMFAPLLSKINQIGGGRKFADGVINIDNTSSSLNNVLFQTANIENLLSQQVELLKQPQRAFVVSTDMTDQQEEDNRIQGRASF